MVFNIKIEKNKPASDGPRRTAQSTVPRTKGRPVTTAAPRQRLLYPSTPKGNICTPTYKKLTLKPPKYSKAIFSLYKDSGLTARLNPTQPYAAQLTANLRATIPSFASSPGTLELQTLSHARGSRPHPPPTITAANQPLHPPTLTKPTFRHPVPPSSIATAQRALASFFPARPRPPEKEQNPRHPKRGTRGHRVRATESSFPNLRHVRPALLPRLSNGCLWPA